MTLARELVPNRADRADLDGPTTAWRRRRQAASYVIILTAVESNSSVPPQTAFSLLAQESSTNGLGMARERGERR